MDLPLATGTSVKITNTPDRAEDQPAWSPTGDRIAYTRVSEVSRSGNRTDIYSIPATGGAEVRITSKSTTGSPRNGGPCHSPGGQFVSYWSGNQWSVISPFGDDAIYRIKAAGT